MLPPYAELHCLSNFSFLRGASHPEELVERAQAQGYAALALTDECSVAGVVRAHLAAKDAGLPLLVGSEFPLDDGLQLVLYATNRDTYGDLTQLITRGRRNADKGTYALTRADVAALAPRCLALWLPGSSGQPSRSGRRAAPQPPGRRPRAAPLRHGSPPRPARSRRRRPLVRRRVPRPRVDRRRALRALRRPRAPRDAAGAGARDRPAAGRRRRRAHARARAARAAGHARPRSACARRSPNAATRSSPTASATCARARAWPRSIRANSPTPRSTSSRAARSRSTSCATSIRRKWCRRAAPPPRTCARWSRRASCAAIGARRRGSEAADVRELIEHELALIAELQVRALLPHRARHRRVRALARHPVPGPRVRRQLGRVLRARHHRGRPGADEHAVRALHQPRAQRAARHRRRLRAPAARGSDAVRLRASTAANAPAWPPRSSPTGRRARCATWARRSASISRRSTGSPACSRGGTAARSIRRASAKPASIPPIR